ncbi:bifunctional alpha/beta hydrolase/OsmC family protein [Aquimarina sp. ERC-38]|uniref:bifunctional alpha/beta hydrolase/OsmC family protein n=1 Tax=Aquimarina sp. ERC-38 TaxID=2949996 RepID=UPI0022484479|nr:bifunctional alpha/beta hydrolase/OsmC family protein [Aquimarina sp. ERC-38]UZO80320.1 bifunctional alpha/beta hydrolase/OsmC family protein [Aquimarina sp. ERC-38]
MGLQKVTFQNKEGHQLTGRLDLPADQHPHNYALFAHCFTCNKNLGAVRNISQALTNEGFGVLRFDFTGLGESDGDFEDTNFSGNVEDLIAAAAYLTKEYQAPSLLVGHSLGGAAAIFAASQLTSVKAVTTVGAPSNPKHVQKLLKSNLAEIEEKGVATVNLSGRDFTIKKQFLEDLETKSLPDAVKEFDKALLVMHSPQDTTVGINNAEEIYMAAKHPKSFVSLDGADHLLMNKKDSLYVGKVIAGWSSRYVDMPEEPKIKTKHQVVASLDSTEEFTTQMKAGSHYFIADEPIDFGGNNFGPTPYDYISAGLSACTAMTIQMYARRKKWEINTVEVHTSYDKIHKEDCDHCEETTAKIDLFQREIRFGGNLDQKQVAKLLEIADKCPVHKTLASETKIETKLLTDNN